MESTQEIIIEAEAWSTEAAQSLGAAKVHADVIDLQQQVERNEAVLFRVRQGVETVGFYMLRVEGSEGVLVAGEGHLPGVDLTAGLIPVIEQQLAGCRSIRVHTARPGLIKKLARLGYAPREFIMGKTL